MKNSDNAKVKMDMKIWQLGRDKANLTTIINKLNQTSLKDHPDIIKAIAVLVKERERLKNIQLF